MTSLRVRPKMAAEKLGHLREDASEIGGMQTPWGDFPVRDAHAHLFTRRFFETMAGLAAPGRLAGPDPVENLAEKIGLEIPAERGGAAARWGRELQERGVEATVLMGSIPGEIDEVAEAVEALGGRCIGYAMVDPTKPDAPKHIARMREGSRWGAAFFPAMHGYRISDEAIRSALDAVRDSGLVAFVHFGLLRLGLRDKLGAGCPFDLNYANPIDLHTVALTYPEVTFQIPHFGCGFFREVLLLGAQVSNVVLDTSSSNSWIKTQAPGITLEEVFARALDVYGPERILFGTDSSVFPRGCRSDIFEEQVGILEKLGVTADEAAGVLGENLARFTGAFPNGSRKLILRSTSATF